MWTVSKRRFIGIVCIFFAIAVIMGLFFNKNISVAKINRKLPIYSVATNEKKIAITFDAAWSAEDTKELIAILKKHNAKITVFAVGEWVTRNPEAVKAFYKNGHEIGNHSATHPAFSKLSREEIRKEIVDCNNEIKKITGKSPKTVRAPSGDYDNKSVEIAEKLQILHHVAVVKNINNVVVNNSQTQKISGKTRVFLLLKN
jgi:peptidoglycan/xylan/chitin deacetylase (PgdA/CDA1 family)